MAADPDDALLLCARRGEEAAIEALFRRHSGAVRSFALRMSGGRADLADEITQETFIRAFRGLGRFGGRSSFRTWLFSIAVNRARTQLGRAGARVTATLEEAADGGDGLAAAPTADGADPWLRARVAEGLAALPEGYRDVLVLHDVLGFDHPEIAEARGCSVGTSKSQLHKARARLRSLLGALRPEGARTTEAAHA